MISPARRAALEVLSRVELHDEHSDDALRIASVGALPQRDRNLVTSIVYGTLRWRSQLDFVLAAASSRSWLEVETEVKVVLRMSLLQLWRLDRVPDYAVVSDAVDLIRSRGMQRAAGFANAVLRSAARRRLWADSGFEESLPDPCRACLPQWLWDRWARRYGKGAAMEFALSLNETPRAAFTVPAGLPADRVPPGAIPSDIVPGACFAGPELTPDVRIMDEASQLIPHLLGVEPGWTVWDACAAPGGKSSILLELAGETGCVFCSDSSVERARFMRTVLQAGQPAGKSIERILAADARRPPFRGRFDAVLVDAPCSGLGTLRRNPEIKWRFTEERLLKYQALQLEILGSASAAVAPGGRLLYSTCSTEPEENEEVVAQFLASSPGFVQLVPATPPGARPFVDESGFLRTFPGNRLWDGFFAALFERRK